MTTASKYWRSLQPSSTIRVGGSAGEQGVVLLAQLGAHQHDGGRRVGDQALDLRAHGVQVAKVERDKARAHAVATRLALHALDDRGMEGALVQDGARLARASTNWMLSSCARLLIAKRLRALQDDLGGLLAHAALAVERVGHGCGRKAGNAADLADACFSHRSPCIGRGRASWLDRPVARQLNDRKFNLNRIVNV